MSTRDEARKRLSSDQRGSFVTSDGVRLGYRLGGRPGGRALLFCYGLMCSGFHFKYQWERFARDHRLLMLDYRGHLSSDFPRAATTLGFPRLADDLVEFLAEARQKGPVTVVGHSMGVNLALELYARHPSRVDGLVLMGGGATFPARSRAEASRVGMIAAGMKIVDGLFPKLARDLWRLNTTAPFADRIAGVVGFNTRLSKPEDISRVVEVMAGFSPRVFAQLLGEYVRHDRTDTAARVDVPTLVISGDRDRAVSPEFHRRLHGLIAGSRLLTIKGGSHCPQFDRPEEVNDAMADFFQIVHSATA